MPHITADTVWIVLGSALVLFMVGGYLLFDIGSTRSKSTQGVVVRHLLVTFTSILTFMFLGYGLFFGGTGGFFGVLDFFSLGSYGPTLPDGVPSSLFVLSQALVCAVCANIVAGTIAERASIACHVVYSIVLALLIYPMASNWTWGNGFLAQMGFHDFAGTASLNLVGGTVALVAAMLVGARSGKYDDAGRPQAIPGQSIGLQAVGVFVIFFGWFGLMGVCTLSFGTASLDALGVAFLNMVVAAVVSGLTALIATSVRYGSCDVPVVLNALIGGLVACSSGADVMLPVWALVVGALAGLVSVFGIEYVERRFRVDDPVGSVAVHGFSAVLGLLACGLFASGSGLVMGGGAGLFSVELLGAVVVAAWAAVVGWVALSITKKAGSVRVTGPEEAIGLGMSNPSIDNAFSEFLPALGGEDGTSPKVVRDVPPSQAIPLELGAPAVPAGAAGGRPPLRQVRIITKPARLGALKEGLGEIGVTGMTISHVMGYGAQRGARGMYRGVPVVDDMIPKVQVDIVVAKVPVEDVVRAARRALYTGHIGDGKIFVYDVAEAVKVRTGEHGYDAVQGIDLV
ncbi:MAG: adenylate cyclase [Coriobacteriia bacterium]|nr:adenylate cyclase [Coriobacteriia bacterium]MBS5477243.1 adenylate cyclase [Coriobacteriia bacterium]